MTTLLEEPAMADETAELYRDMRIEGLLREWNLDFDFDAEYPLRKIDVQTDTQVRLPEHRAPRDTVEEFTTQMRGQLAHDRISFPPLVLTHNGRLIDGNTRKQAAEQNGLETFHVYLVKLPRADFGPMIGAALNQMGGKRLTAEESFAAAEKMMREGYADEAIARTLGRSTQMVRNYRTRAPLPRCRRAHRRRRPSPIAVSSAASRRRHTRRAVPGRRRARLRGKGGTEASAGARAARVRSAVRARRARRRGRVPDEVEARRAAAAAEGAEQGCARRRPQSRCGTRDRHPGARARSRGAAGRSRAEVAEAPRPGRQGARRVRGGTSGRHRRGRVTDNVIPFQPGEEDAGLEPLGKYRPGRGMDPTTRLIFDVLYEADVPLDPDTIAERTYARASGAAQGHARRAMIRQRESNRRSDAKRRGATTRETTSLSRDMTLEEAWQGWTKRILAGLRRWGRVIRDEEGRYRPNPDRPPRAMRADGTVYPYTRQAWEETTAHERAVGEIQTMRMEADRLLGSLDPETLRFALQLAARDFDVGELTRGKNAARNLRYRIGWLLQRPTTDAGRAWLLHELVRRAYGPLPEI